MAAAPVATDFSALARLRADARAQSPEALREAAKQFESLFTQMLLKSMRATSFGDDLTGDHGGFYRDLLDQQLAAHLSAGKGLGLAEMMVRQLQQSGTDLSAPASAAPVRADKLTMEASPQKFVQEVWPHAQQAAAELGVSPRVLVAQAALETGWGAYPIRRADGAPSHNLFGIKAGTRWEGERAASLTTEFANGVPEQRREEFRAYDSPAASFSDYVQHLKSHPRYAEALRQGQDEAGFAQALQHAGYATDPLYAEKLLRVAQGPALNTALAQLGAAQTA